MSQAGQTSSSSWTLLFSVRLLASGSAMGSVFFSHVMEFAPCVLCWYQRICLFPLVLILAAGLFPLDRSVVKYALPLAAAGWLTRLVSFTALFRDHPRESSALHAGSLVYGKVHQPVRFHYDTDALLAFVFRDHRPGC